MWKTVAPATWTVREDAFGRKTVITTAAALALFLSAPAQPAAGSADNPTADGPAVLAMVEHDTPAPHVQPAPTTGIKLNTVRLGPDRPDRYILIQSLIASPDSHNVTYLHRFGDDLGFDGVALNGKNHLAVLESTQPVFSPNSKTLGFLVRESGNRWKLFNHKHEFNGFEPSSTVRFSPDGERLIYMARYDDKRFVVEFDRPHPKAEALDWDNLVFSPDSSVLAYPAMVKGQWRMVVNGDAGPAWHRIVTAPLTVPDGSNVFFVAYKHGRYHVVDRHTDITAPDPTGLRHGAGHRFIEKPPVASADGSTLVYWALDDDQRWRLYKNGKHQPKYDADRPGELLVSSDGKHIAAVCKQGDTWRVVHDGEPGPGFPAIGSGSLTMSPDGKRLAYAVRKPAGWAVMLDGQEKPTFPQLAASGMRFSPDSRRFVYTVLRQGRWAVIEDNDSHPEFSQIHTQSIAFSPDSQRLTYLASFYDRPTIVLDGQPLGDYDAVLHPTFSPDSEHLVYIAQQSDGYRLYVDGEPTAESFDELIPGATIHFKSKTLCQTVALRRPHQKGSDDEMTYGKMPTNSPAGPSLWRFEIDLTKPLPPDHNGTPAPAPAPGDEPAPEGTPEPDPNALDPSFVDVPTD